MTGERLAGSGHSSEENLATGWEVLERQSGATQESGWEALEQYDATMPERINAEINKAFNNPMTPDTFDKYEELASTINEKQLQTGQYDAELEAKANNILDAHSAVAKNPQEFRELLSQMSERYPQIDFMNLYYEHELSHNQKADELGFINHGFRVVILQDEDGHQEFLPAQATEPQPDWSLREYYEKQLETLAAPGDDMSDGDKADYADYAAKLRALAGETPKPV
ncbi:MAG: hypothetical protein LBM12_00395 [Candidatus Nomurabacteria bacterium]|jgi:uncharacterized phage infection (PIP) family protein YhgE|nr:hypothetical protein [Candidatus Nomurabacteria bacterium]